MVPGPVSSGGRSSSVTTVADQVPSLDPRHLTGCPGVVAERLWTVICGETMKQDSSPIPNCPMKSLRDIPHSSRFDDAPMVASRPSACPGVRPMPVSVTVILVPSVTIRISAGQLGSIARCAVIASTPFCRSSRTKTWGPE